MLFIFPENIRVEMAFFRIITPAPYQPNLPKVELFHLDKIILHVFSHSLKILLDYNYYTSYNRIMAITSEHPTKDHTMRKHIQESKMQVVHAMSKNAAFNDINIIECVNYLQRQGANLHTKFVHQCNGTHWNISAEYGEAYDIQVEKQITSIFAKATTYNFLIAHNVNYKDEQPAIRINTDPRGWPIVLYINNREYRLGGK